MRQADLVFNILTAAALGVVIALACDHVHAGDGATGPYSQLPGGSRSDTVWGWARVPAYSPG